MGFEPTTFSLARRRTTTVLRPRFRQTIAESAETQNRTVDTAIFSRVLYQLSYLGDIQLLSVRNFTLGERDCQESDSAFVVSGMTFNFLDLVKRRLKQALKSLGMIFVRLMFIAPVFNGERKI